MIFEGEAGRGGACPILPSTPSWFIPLGLGSWDEVRRIRLGPASDELELMMMVIQVPLAKVGCPDVLMEGRRQVNDCECERVTSIVRTLTRTRLDVDVRRGVGRSLCIVYL